METKLYTMSELEQMTGMSRRTIHYYVSQKLIPAPESKGGPGAKYGEEQLVRLQLIRILQDELKLEKIREALASMSEEEMRCIITDAESGVKKWNAAAVSSWVSGQGNSSAAVTSRPAAKLPGNFSFAKIGEYQEPPLPVQPVNLLAGLRRPMQPKGDLWQRLQISDGIELNVRSDVSTDTLSMALKEYLEQTEEQR
jgi:DNA-binding transcriptional MerR regulator